MKISPSGKSSKLAVLLLAAGVVPISIVWIAKTYLAERVGWKVSLRNFQLATRLDPENSEYQLRLGRLYQYDPAEMDPDQAMTHLARAAELSPYDPQAWLDLGAAFEFQANTAQAEACLRRADFLAPDLPPIQWAIGNFFLLHGNIDEAFRHFKVVLAGNPRYNQTIFDTAWKASGDPEKILRELIPEHPAAEFDYLNYLLTRHDYPDAQNVWKRLSGGSESFSAPRAAGYIDTLMAAHRLAEADEVWGALRSKGLVPPTYQQSSRNLVMNGDFEADPLNMGFDWRLVPTAAAYTGIDRTTFHSPGRSALIQFSGKENVFYRHLFQYVRVAPRHAYRLQAFMKTEEITTDSGPRLEVRDAYDPSQLDRYSEYVTGSVPWSPLLLDFTTGAKTELLVVSVARVPSQKFDNLIGGKAWVDDISLAPLP